MSAQPTQPNSSYDTDYSLVEPPTGVLQIPQNPPQTKPSPQFSLVIPTYQESKNIAKIVQVLTQLLDPTLPNRYELIVVDDDSPDGTWQVAWALMSEYPQLQVIRRQRERGLSTAIIRGWQVASGQILGVIDGDLQHPPEILLKLLNEVEAGADLAVASRHIEGGGVSDWSLVRRILSRGAQLVGLLLLPKVLGRVSDPMSGYFLVRRSAIGNRTLNPLGYKILIEVLARGSIRNVAEVGYVFQERQAGESKVTWKQYLEYLQHLVRLRFSTGRIGHLRKQYSLPIQRFLRFGAVGFSGVFVDIALLYCLHDPSMLGWGLTRSKILAAEAAIANNFIWNDLWTFSDISRTQRGWKQRLKRFLKFNIICLMGLILNVLLLNLLFNVFHIHYLVANIIAIAAVTLWNFWVNWKLSWRSTDINQ